MHGLWSRRDLLAIETASLFFSDANNYGDPRPSELDVTIAKTTDKMVYVGSRDGLYSVDPDGNVRHVFSKINWFDKRSHGAWCSGNSFGMDHERAVKA